MCAPVDNAEGVEVNHAGSDVHEGQVYGGLDEQEHKAALSQHLLMQQHCVAHAAEHVLLSFMLCTPAGRLSFPFRAWFFIQEMWKRGQVQEQAGSPYCWRSACWQWLGPEVPRRSTARSTGSRLKNYPSELSTPHPPRQNAQRDLECSMLSAPQNERLVNLTNSEVMRE